MRLKKKLTKVNQTLQISTYLILLPLSYEIVENKINFTIDLVEEWYVWPYPILEISERNFNVWWDDFQSSNYKDFSRFNYGVFLNIENFRGLNELLHIKFRKGFKEHYMLRYEVPYLNKLESFGLNTHIELFRRKKHTLEPLTINFNTLKITKTHIHQMNYYLNFEIIYNKI